mmetsp:Transcript_75207/g.196052  ORF Transcript_75207/g.196052 Transcript_75207/m.196052 type:complete len:436 (+) Transcript_75207:470-1777(+)
MPPRPRDPADDSSWAPHQGRRTEAARGPRGVDHHLAGRVHRHQRQRRHQRRRRAPGLLRARRASRRRRRGHGRGREHARRRGVLLVVPGRLLLRALLEAGSVSLEVAQGALHGADHVLQALFQAVGHGATPVRGSGPRPRARAHGGLRAGREEAGPDRGRGAPPPEQPGHLRLGGGRGEPRRGRPGHGEELGSGRWRGLLRLDRHGAGAVGRGVRAALARVRGSGRWRPQRVLPRPLRPRGQRADLPALLPELAAQLADGGPQGVQLRGAARLHLRGQRRRLDLGLAGPLRLPLRALHLQLLVQAPQDAALQPGDGLVDEWHQGLFRLLHDAALQRPRLHLHGLLHLAADLLEALPAPVLAFALQDPCDILGPRCPASHGRGQRIHPEGLVQLGGVRRGGRDAGGPRAPGRHRPASSAVARRGPRERGAVAAVPA